MLTGIYPRIWRGYPDWMPSLSPEARPHSIRLPHWGWFLLATVVLVVGFVGVSVWLPWHREEQLREKIEGWGGYSRTWTDGPVLLQKLVGEHRVKALKVFTRINFVQLFGAKTSDAEVAHLKGCTQLEFLLLNRTAVTDAGLPHLERMTNLKYLYLDDTLVTDSGLSHLSKLTSLRELDISGTAVTDRGVEELKKALPACEIKH